jgi:hypothetical protein
MDLKSLIDLGTQTLAVFKDHIVLLLALLVVAFIIGALWRRSVDDGEVRGLRAQKQAADDRLQLAHDQNERVLTQVHELEAKVEQQNTGLSAPFDELPGMIVQLYEKKIELNDQAVAAAEAMASALSGPKPDVDYGALATEAPFTCTGR